MKILVDIYRLFHVEVIKLSVLREVLEFMLLSILSFFIPFLIGSPQVLIGIVINFMLARNAITMKNWKNLPTILFPSLGVFTRGLVFASFTVYLAYMIPAIWLGNFVFVCFIKLFASRNTLKATFMSSIAKSGIIFLYAYLLVKLSIIPDTLLTSMGIIQLITSMIGSSVCLFLSRSEINHFK